jgi:hypothetical protein
MFLFPCLICQIIENKLDSFSQDLPGSTKEFEYLTLTQNLTWQGVHVILTASLKGDKRNHIQTAAIEYMNDLNCNQTNKYTSRANVVLNKDPQLRLPGLPDGTIPLSLSLRSHVDMFHRGNKKEPPSNLLILTK